MDLGAYAQIEDLEIIAKENGIDVPRLRGYRLMRDEEPVNLKEVINRDEIAVGCVKKLCEAEPFWNIHPEWWSLCDKSDFYKSYYMTYTMKESTYKKFNRVRWDRIHGWKRRVLKTYIHNEIKRKAKQWETWNKYAGRDDILYIHARIGGGNWSYYYQQVVNQPWFIEKVDDCYDSTYCDIYARITPIKGGENNV